jgi:hypothetical protein
MNVFDIRQRLVDEYREYVQSFVDIADPRIEDKVSSHLSGGELWPEPLLQLNPSFETGKTVDELVDEGLLCPRCRSVFRIKSAADPTGKTMRLHLHQEEAIRAARRGSSYVLTTGTGSGKSLAYIIPIVDHVLRNGTGNGIQAIVVYPMNALANSQMGELDKFIFSPEEKRSVSFKRYTGQESQQEREQITANPPDILLTNYMMLELILTRWRDKELIRKSGSLAFLVLDELHTYRGRQGLMWPFWFGECGKRSARLRCVAWEHRPRWRGGRRPRSEDRGRSGGIMPVRRNGIRGRCHRRDSPQVNRGYGRRLTRSRYDTYGIGGRIYRTGRAG